MERHKVLDCLDVLTTAASLGSSALLVTSHSSSTNGSYSCKTQIHSQVRNHYPNIWLNLPLDIMWLS